MDTNASAEMIAQEIKQLELASAAREQKAEREAVIPPSVARLRAALASARAAASALARVESGLGVDLGAIDPQLKPAVGAARAAAVRAERAKEAAAIVDGAVAEIASARDGSASLIDARAHRRRATFDPVPVADATIRAAWIARLSHVSVPDLADFASVAIETRSVALASAVEEAIDAHEPIPAAATADRVAATEARRRIATLVPPAVDEARQLLLDLDVAERSLRERARIIAGGTPSGSASIAVGLLERAAQDAAA